MKHIILGLTLALTACGEMNHGEHGDMGHHNETGIVISSAYVMPPFPGKDVAGGFFEITNHGADDRLLSVTSPISGQVEIHTHLEENGVMKMRKIDGLDLPSSETVIFRPGSYHLMMFGSDMPESQDDVALTLTFEKAEPVTIIAPLGEPDEEMDHSGH